MSTRHRFRIFLITILLSLITVNHVKAYNKTFLNTINKLNSEGEKNYAQKKYLPALRSFSKAYNKVKYDSEYSIEVIRIFENMCRIYLH
ncbi:MAG: hypothetical protein ACYS6K_28000, partial [Planctomycetota bacterium]